MRRRFSLVLLCLLACNAQAQDFGLKLPPGFRITLFADSDLANDIYAMTLDPHGRVVVTSRGWVKRLDDTDGDGKADKATVLLETKSGGMGMCFDEGVFYLCADGQVRRYEVKDRDAGLGNPIQFTIPLRFGEHGGHAIRMGPDGSLYIVGGNDAGLAELPNISAVSPIRKVQAGGIFRMDRWSGSERGAIEVIAHGFRNPYDFDFTPLGDIITYDSDTERDFLLPWYSPTRLYHVAYGQHHGWRVPGYMRSLARRDYYADTVDILVPIGRGSPTGVVCYRHTQFPEHYRGGVFFLDWTFGRVWFTTLIPDGSTYKAKPEVFIEPIGSNGFAPTDVCVAPDGSLFISIGGRGTRGAVYRVEYLGDGKVPVKAAAEPESDLLKVLDAPQPLDAWSRAKWVRPAWRNLEKLWSSMSDPGLSELERVRSVEILTEMDLFPKVCDTAAASESAIVRARAAWAMRNWAGQTRRRDRFEVGPTLLLKLAMDSNARVRVEALPGLAELARSGDKRVPPVVAANLAHADKRVRLAAMQLASLLPQSAWRTLDDLAKAAGPRARIMNEIAALESGNSRRSGDSGVLLAAEVLESSKDPELCLDAVRLIMLCYGDWNLASPPAEVYSAYSLPAKQRLTGIVLRAVRPRFPSGNELLDGELARLLAMFEDDDPKSVQKVLAQVTANSPPTRDVHYLIVLARLMGKRDAKLAEPTANAVLALEKKLHGLQSRMKQNWDARLGEVIADLLRKQPGLGEAMLKHPALVIPAHVSFATQFQGEQRTQAAKLFLAAARKDAVFGWTAALVDLLAQLPAAEVRPVFREHWSELGIRDALLTQFAKDPEEADRERFLAGLESSQSGVVQAALKALDTLPRDPAPKNLVPLMKLLRQSLREQKTRTLRADIVKLINRQSSQSFDLPKEATDPPAPALYQPVFAWFEKSHPEEAKALAAGGEDLAAWAKVFAQVEWDKGDAARGARLFQQRACASCHDSSGRIGPDLAGVANRMSRADLFTAIVDPNRDVAPAFRVNDIEAKDGKRVSGIVVFESADGVILQTDAVTTLRIASDDMASRRPSTRSLMPTGLLKELKPAELADLYSYLKSVR